MKREMEFNTSKSEIKRRKKAFIVLVISFAIGLLLFSELFHTQIALNLYISFAVAFALLGMISFRFLNLLKKIKINITNDDIERISGSTSERFLLSEVERIKIKRRKNGDIREIYIFFKNRKHLFLNALEKDFEYLKDIILGRIGKDIPIYERKETINFDHYLFYPSLGLILSFSFVYFLKAIANIDYNSMKYYEFVISIMTCTLALFFAIGKPISKRVTNKVISFDYIIAITMLISSVYIFIIGVHL
jgi:hypothetical protein